MTKTKSLTLYISLLPIIVIVMLIIGAGYLLTKGEIELPGSGNSIKARSLEGFPATILTANIIEKQRVVLKSQEELDAFLKEVDSTGQFRLNEKINFNREYIIAVTSKTLATDGYKLKVEKIYNKKEKDEYLVKLLLTEPGEECEVENATNVTVDLVAIKKTDKPIDFERFKTTKECN